MLEHLLLGLLTLPVSFSGAAVSVELDNDPQTVIENFRSCSYADKYFDRVKKTVPLEIKTVDSSLAPAGGKFEIYQTSIDESFSSRILLSEDESPGRKVGHLLLELSNIYGFMTSKKREIHFKAKEGELSRKEYVKAMVIFESNQNRKVARISQKCVDEGFWSEESNFLDSSYLSMFPTPEDEYNFMIDRHDPYLNNFAKDWNIMYKKAYEEKKKRKRIKTEF